MPSCDVIVALREAARSLPRLPWCGKRDEAVEKCPTAATPLLRILCVFASVRPADKTESVIRGDHYGQSNDRQKVLWHQSREQVRCEESRSEKVQEARGAKKAAKKPAKKPAKKVAKKPAKKKAAKKK